MSQQGPQTAERRTVGRLMNDKPGGTCKKVAFSFLVYFTTFLVTRKIQSIFQCFPTRVPQIIVRHSSRNGGRSKHFLNTAKNYIYIYIYICRVSQEECARLRENVS